MVEDADIVTRVARARVLVVGDVVLDEYLYGRPTRLSREAPIPVLEFERRNAIPGGAANPAQNIAALGAQALLGAVVGADLEGRQLADLIERAGVRGRLVVDDSRPTTVKTRIVSEGLLRFPQQVARIDRLSRVPVDPTIIQALLQLAEASAGQVDAVLCSDYLSGLLTPGLVSGVQQLCARHGLLLTVDAQGELHKYRGADLLRCNAEEAAAFLRCRLESEADYQDALATLLHELAVKLVVVTRGAGGVSLIGQELGYTHIPAHRVEVADVTGAGDTFIAVMTLALTTDLPPRRAAELANAAASLVVRRIGNAVVTPDELRATLVAGGHYARGD
jgi:D-glycero-beta-D-manno-heptose-7-phosphate kinase